MKKLVISGSSKLYERALYWRGYFEGRGYEVIDWPRPLFEDEDFSTETPPAPGFSLGRLLTSNDSTYADHLTKFYQQYYKHLDQTDVFFLMNEDKNGIEGYIGPSAFSELTYAIIGNLNRGRKVEIQMLKMPSKDQGCYDEIKFWLDQDWMNIYQRPTGKKATIPVPDDQPAPESQVLPETAESTTSAAEDSENLPPISSLPQVSEGEIIESTPHRSGFFHRGDKNLDLLTCKKRCLRHLTPEAREYLKILCPSFPAWLLKYIAAPEFQRLAGVSMVSVDHSSLYNFSYSNSVFQHSIGVALIIWNFTHDKKQTLAGLFHDIAAPAFKHCIDFMNGDAETQESIEKDTGRIIRESKVIARQLKKDGILPSEVSDYHLYSVADNDTPNLAADRLEYTFSNGYFLYGTWSLDQIKTFYTDLTLLKNEDNLDEIAFKTPAIATEFTTNNLTLAANYHSDKSRATMQFLADIVRSMIISGYLTTDDLYVMSEREIIDWILSCGDKTIAEAFRQFQRATSVYSGATAKKNCYCTSVKAKVRYIVPLVLTTAKDGSATAKRITKLNREVSSAVEAYLDEKPAKYVGFDFDFKPYTE